MLTQTAFQPLYGRISDLVGRKVRQHLTRHIRVADAEHIVEPTIR